MITPDFIDNVENTMDSLMRPLENDVIQDITRRIAKTMQITETSQYLMTRWDEINGFSRSLLKRISDLIPITLKEIDKLIEEAANESHSYDVKRFADINRKVTPLEDNKKYKQLQKTIKKHTKNEFKNLMRTKALGFKGLPAQQFFISRLDSAVMKVSSGLFSYNDAIKQTIIELNETGLQSIQYGKRNMNITVAVRMNVLTAVRQMADEVSIMNGEALGLDLIETSAHATARPSHVLWQGRRFTFKSFDEIKELQYRG